MGNINLYVNDYSVIATLEEHITVNIIIVESYIIFSKLKCSMSCPRGGPTVSVISSDLVFQGTSHTF